MFITKRNQKMKHSSGFTLLELMIVVVIVAILASIVYPSYQLSIQKARRGDAQEALLECAAAQSRIFTASTPSGYMNAAAAQARQVCGANGTAFISQESFYDITIDVTGCGNGPFFCFTLTAAANPNNVQRNDDRCVAFTYDDRGNRSAEDSDGTDTTAECWRS